jgi:DNA-binding transcriptional LysR family regulator
LSEAAAALGIRVTTLISQLNKLEDETGLELLQRSSGRRRRTAAYSPEGRHLAEQLRAALETIASRQQHGPRSAAAGSVAGFTRMHPARR